MKPTKSSRFRAGKSGNPILSSDEGVPPIAIGSTKPLTKKTPRIDTRRALTEQGKGTIIQEGENTSPGVIQSPPEGGKVPEEVRQRSGEEIGGQSGRGYDPFCNHRGTPIRQISKGGLTRKFVHGPEITSNVQKHIQRFA